MTKEHLPECRYYPSQSIVGDVGCICSALRACEARVREQYATDWQTEQEAVHLAGLDLAYRKGLQAARDAVAALAPRLSMTKNEGGYDCCGCSTPDELHDDALAAIDELRNPPSLPPTKGRAHKY